MSLPELYLKLVAALLMAILAVAFGLAARSGHRWRLFALFFVLLAVNQAVEMVRVWGMWAAHDTTLQVVAGFAAILDPLVLIAALDARTGERAPTAVAEAPALGRPVWAFAPMSAVLLVWATLAHGPLITVDLFAFRLALALYTAGAYGFALQRIVRGVPGPVLDTPRRAALAGALAILAIPLAFRPATVLHQMWRRASETAPDPRLFAVEIGVGLALLALVLALLHSAWQRARAPLPLRAHATMLGLGTLFAFVLLPPMVEVLLETTTRQPLRHLAPLRAGSGSLRLIAAGLLVTRAEIGLAAPAGLVAGRRTVARLLLGTAAAFVMVLTLTVVASLASARGWGPDRSDLWILALVLVASQAFRRVVDATGTALFGLEAGRRPPGPRAADHGIPAHLRPGTLIGARYRLTAPIGTGGRGRVFAAFDERLQRPVALKVTTASSGTGNAWSEGRAAAAAAGPAVVQVYDAVEDGSRVAVVMEFMPGGSVAQLNEASGGALGHDLATRVIHQTAIALQAVHDAGYAHGDVKPSNLLIDTKGQVKLADFGSAATPGDRTRGTKWNSAGTFTPRFAAPEVRRGEPPTSQSDVYSLARTLISLTDKDDRAPYRDALRTALAADPLERHADVSSFMAALVEAGFPPAVKTNVERPIVITSP